MSEYLLPRKGSFIKNTKTGDVGIVKKITFINKDVYYAIVKTKKGRQKWIFKIKKKSIFEKIRKFLGF